MLRDKGHGNMRPAWVMNRAYAHEMKRYTGRRIMLLDHDSRTINNLS